jgi:hypothetical protein
LSIAPYHLSDCTLEKLVNLLKFPRGWGTTNSQNRWYRRKRNEAYDLLKPETFKNLIEKIPIVISVSNHNGEVFTNYQWFAITDFDNEKHPENAKIPLELFCKKLDELGIKYVTTESGMKGYHVWIFFDKPLYTKDVEQFQGKIFNLIGFQYFEEQKWVYLPDDYDENKPIEEQDYTIVETLTALGDGKMIKAPFSMHPKRRERHELAYPLSQILVRNPEDPQTEANFIQAEIIFQSAEVNDYREIIAVGDIIGHEDEPASTEKLHKILRYEPKVYFKTPPKSPEMDAKVVKMLEHIVSVPCLTKCLDISMSDSGIYYLRANIVTTLANKGFSREEIAYLIREIINDEADNANRGMNEYQVDYWYRKRFHCRCDYFQEVGNPKFCCEEPCGRRSPTQAEPEPDHIRLTRTKEFEPIYSLCEKLIDGGKKLVVCPKTTRAGFTTALNIVARERNKKIIFFVPRTSISEKTFKDTICLAQEKKGIFINGFVLSANQKACLVRMKEAIEYEKKYGKPLDIEIPIPREDCKTCPYRGTIVTPPPMTPLFESDPINNKCMTSTYQLQRSIFDSGFTTYAKMYAITNTPSEDAKDMIVDIEQYDIIVFDEITQFVEMASFQMPVVLKWREYETADRPTYNYFAVLNKEFEEFMNEKGLSETVEKIHEYINLFIESFSDYDKYKGGDKLTNPLPSQQRGELKLAMITYLNMLYNYHVDTDKPVKSIYDALCLMCEEFWYVEKCQTMEFVSEINFVVPAKHSEIIKWVKGLPAQKIITDAVLPYQDLKTVFGPELEEFPIGDPQGTAATQLVISDTRNIIPTKLFDDEERLINYINAIIKSHGVASFFVVCPNRTTAKHFMVLFPDVPNDNVTWYRSNRTIGVACNLRVMVALSTPYAPVESFDWAAIDITGDKSESKRFWKANARNTFFQAIGRVKDPLAQVLSIVYTYGIKRTELENNLLKNCQGKPNIIEPGILRNNNSVHTIIGKYWLDTGEFNLIPNETRVLAYRQENPDIDIATISKNLEISPLFVDATLKKVTI